MANSTDTTSERERCLGHIGRILHNPSRANLVALVLAVRDGASSFDPPDADSDAPDSSLEQDVAAPSAGSVDVEFDEDACDSDVEAAEAAAEMAE